MPWAFKIGSRRDRSMVQADGMRRTGVCEGRAIGLPNEVVVDDEQPSVAVDARTGARRERSTAANKVTRHIPREHILRPDW